MSSGGRPSAALHRLSITPPAEGFGGKDSVKGNHQGSLSRWINNFLKLQKSFKKFVSLEKRLFQQSDRPRRIGGDGFF